MAKSRFVLKQRHTRGDDLKQLADIMEKIFPKEISKCTYKGNVFPWYFTVNARAIKDDEDPEYAILEDAIVSCMHELGMKVPLYPKSAEDMDNLPDLGRPSTSSTNVTTIDLSNDFTILMFGIIFS